MFEKGTQIAYVPMHVINEIGLENINAVTVVRHADKYDGIEFGFVMSKAPIIEKGTSDFFCRYWVRGKLGTLRTVANSERTPEHFLYPIHTVPQEVVSRAIEEIENSET